MDIDQTVEWLSSLGLSLGNCTFEQALSLRSHESESPSAIVFHSDAKVNPTDVGYELHDVSPYPYQEAGIRYLDFMYATGVGCVLADEMGLGKTLQAIGLLTIHHPTSPVPSIVVAPATLLENWRRELARFAPQLRVVSRWGGRRSFELEQYSEVDVVITSYETMVSDIGFLSRLDWNIVLFDEAQYLKNPSAIRTRSAKRLKSRFTTAITGTPFENHMTDTWSLINLVVPNYLDSLEHFAAKYGDNVTDANRLSWIIEPLVLRRRVEDVAKELPERLDIPIFLQPSPAIQTEQLEIVKKIQNSGRVLPYLQTLRTIAAHAREEDFAFSESMKFSYLKDALWEIFTSGEKALVFCSFNLTAERLCEWLRLSWSRVTVDLINGSTPIDSRQAVIDKFSKASAGVLVLNPQAAGVGLNITSANHVFHFNPEWNPSLTEQASKRAHRNGQTRPVTVHYLFYRDTIEEVVASSQELKRAIGKALVPGVLLPLDENVILSRILELGQSESHIESSQQ